MAAYAALVSLMNTVDAIQNHPRLSTSLDKYQAESLKAKLDSLLRFVEDYFKPNEEVENLKTQIGSAAHAAEVVIEGHIVDRCHARSKQESSDEEQPLDLQKIIEDVGSLMEKVNNVKEKVEHEEHKPIDSMPTAASSRSYGAAGKTSMVGFEGYMYQLKDRLIEDRSELRIIPITGMGGIGKTTLAKNVYDDLLIVQNFDKRAWVTVSQEYSVRKILAEILSCVGASVWKGESENKLGEMMYKILFGRRYLIILDDMWSVDAWKKLHSFFPNQKDGSRIVVTTRQSDVAEYFNTSALILSFLDVDKSWQLFCEKVFAHEDCPPELEGVGRKIVKKCGGLPLAIVVVGGLLGTSSRVQEYWENVEKNMSSIVNSAEENLCSNLLSLSYNYLPLHLKPCFLYLGIFPEDSDIPVTRLVRLWIAEGFIKSNKDQSLEDVGEGYVKDLEGRNLIVVQRELLHYNKTFRNCKVHDLLRELCIKTAEKEKFFYVISGHNSSRDIDREGHRVFHKIIIQRQPRYDLGRQVVSLSVGGEIQFQKSELWKVCLDGSFDPREYTSKQFSLRFYQGSSGRHHKRSRVSMPLWWNLQTFILRETVYSAKARFFEIDVRSDIWEMTQLRHVQLPRIHLRDPPPSDDHDRIVLENLQTLGTVINFKCSEEVYKRMPNIKKLRIEYYRNFFSDQSEDQSLRLNYISHVDCFNKLESLQYSFSHGLNRDELPQNLKFPNSLKKLRLDGCKLHWDDLTIIGSLPHLEVLKLGYDSFQGPTWIPIENQFRGLKFLEISSFDLINWNADSSHFPVLEKLTLRVGKLDEIPEGMGEIPTLRVISMHYCRASVAISALKILKQQQEDFGNNGIKVFVKGYEEVLKEVREWVELERISTDNVRLYSSFFGGRTPACVYYGPYRIGDSEIS